MKVAVFVGKNDVVILSVKGDGTKKEDIVGLDEWFGRFSNSNRELEDYDVSLCELGGDLCSGIHVCVNPTLHDTEGEEDINSWFNVE